MPRSSRQCANADVGAADCGSGGRWFESTQLYQIVQYFQRITQMARPRLNRHYFSGPVADLSDRDIALRAER